MKILIVDDNDGNRYLMESLLEPHGHRAESCTNGAEALEKLRADRFDLIVSDILLPVMDGFQFCRNVKGDPALRRIPFVFYTATYTGQQDEAFALKIGADRFLQKPCEPDVFLDAIREVTSGGSVSLPAAVPEECGEDEILKLYNERLVRKLEQKMLELEKEIETRRETEEELVQRERYYRTLLFDLHEDIVVIDRRCRISDINHTALLKLGRTREDTVGRCCHEALFGLDAPCHVYGKSCFLPEVFASGQPYNWYREDLRPDGNAVHIDIRMSPIKDPDGRVTHAVMAARDLTDLFKTQQALEASERTYRMLAENTLDVIWSMNPDLEFTYVNPAIRSLMGYSPQEWIGSRLSDHCDEESFLKINQIVARQIAEGPEESGVIVEAVMIRKDCTAIPVEIHGRVVFDECGAPVLLQGVTRNISERRKAEAERSRLSSQLLQAQKLESIGNLAGGIAHDFNNILSSILGFTEIALDEVDKGSSIEDSLQEVYSAGKRAKDLVHQILTFARKSGEEIKPIRAKTVIKEALKFLRSSIPATIDIRQNIVSDASIMSNPTQLQQILMNLCTNAVYAMEDRGGTLQIGLEDVRIGEGHALYGSQLNAGDYARLSVSDTGTGIPPEAIRSLFEPYYTTKASGEGTGLGLAVVHGIVESLGGGIDVQSEMGKGSLFAVYLPAIKSDEVSRPYVDTPLPRGCERILVVDDEPPVAKMNRRILERLGYAVTTCSSAAEALDLFRRTPGDFDLVITDMTMPHMTGDRLAAEMMRIRPDIPVILCSGYSKHISEEAVADLGIKAFAYKPIAKAELAETVRAVLDAVGGNPDGGFHNPVPE